MYNARSNDPTDIHTFTEYHFFLPEAQLGCYVKDYTFSVDYYISVYTLTSNYVAANYHTMTEVPVSEKCFNKIVQFYKTKSLTMNMRFVVKELKRIQKEHQRLPP